MSLLIEDAATVAAIRDLAEKVGRPPEEVVREAVAAAVERQRDVAAKLEKLKALQARAASYGRTGLKADKAFFDELSGGL